MDKLLVTGITGFIGTNLKEYLSNAYEIIGVSRTPNTQNKEIAYTGLYSGDFYAAHGIVHLAGLALNPKYEKDSQRYLEGNTKLTQRVYDAFLASNSEVFVFISSVKAVADEVEGVLTEDDAPDPKTEFGKSKLAAEAYILHNMPTNKRVYILRPCMVHGAGRKGNFSLLNQFVNKGIPFPLGAFENRRSFLSVENLCFIIKELLDSKVDSGVYHLADDKALSTRELIELMASSKGKKVRIWNLPKGFIRALAKVGDILPFPLSTKRLSKLTDNYVVSNSKIKNALGKQLPVGTQQGILRTLEALNDD